MASFLEITTELISFNAVSGSPTASGKENISRNSGETYFPVSLNKSPFALNTDSISQPTKHPVFFFHLFIDIL